MSVVVVGLNHRSARLDVLESMAIGADVLPKALQALRDYDHVDEVAVLSTCMRSEIYISTSRFHAAVGDLRGFLGAWSGHPPEDWVGGSYEYFDDQAVGHLFRVAAGLDSAVLGEGEILRQVRTAWEVARAEGTLGITLGAAGRRAVEAGKRVRSETAIARGTTSLSHTAVMLAGVSLAGGVVPGRAEARPDHRGGRLDAAAGAATACPEADVLRGRRALVLGAGEMGAAVATLLHAGPGIGGVTIANRTHTRAEALAGALGAAAVPWSDLAGALADADVVVSATAAAGPVLDAETVAGALADRAADRPVVVVDLALPRDVDPAVGALPGVTLFDMHDLQAHADAAMAGRRAEIPAAEAILAEELVRWAGASAEREVAPLIAALHDRGESVRAGELARLERRLAGLDPTERRAVEALTKAIVAKLLHEPTVNLKAAAGDERGTRLATSLAELWGLALPEPPE